MPFPFSHVCDLFQQVADLPPARRSQPRAVREVIQAWFATHRAAIDELIAAAAAVPAVKSSSAAAGFSSSLPSSSSASPAIACSSSAGALLSTLLPDRRTDRVYALQARGLQRILIRALGLGRSRVAELARWMRPCDHSLTGPVDLADCVEAILTRTPNPSPDAPPVTVEEIDAVLHGVAARCRFSAPAIRGAPLLDDSSAPPLLPTQMALAGLYQRLDARGAKWLTRLILKDLRPAVLDGAAVARAFHPLLPRALQVHADLEASVQSLGGGGGGNGNQKDMEVRPRLGIKVGRQQWAKGRSIQHCIAMGGPQRMSCERKMDGEYVQVHVNLERGNEDNCLQLFSKSGKDSTWDRVNLHNAIRESLRIGQPDCKLQKGCILEGEMLAYDERECKIMDFDAIRKHVNRSGSRLYCDPRGGTQDHEHLMIVYYDVLLIDDESLLGTRHSDRFRRLEDLVACRAGYAEMVQREVIDFRCRTAAAQLRRAFARCIAARLEGLVVKPDNDPYFDLSIPGNKKSATTTAPLGWPYLKSYVIKLKKEYIGAFGEVGDFAVVGGRYDATKAMEYPTDLPGLRWTHFFIGCLDKAASTSTRPRFVVTNVVTLTVPQMTTFLRHCRPCVVPVERKRDRRKTRRWVEPPRNGFRVVDEADLEFKAATAAAAVLDGERAPFDLAPLEPGLDDSKGGPTELFADPPVVDIRCFSFHRQGYGRFWSPRFPSVVKFHFDRTYADALAFTDLQTMAEAEATRRSEVAEEEVEENKAGEEEREGVTDEERAHWVTQLKRSDPRGIAVDAETSQSSAAATATTARSQSTSSSGPGTSQLASAAAAAMPPVGISLIEEEIEEEEEAEKERDSQLSIVTVKPLEDKNERASVVVTVIDLTGDDDDDDDDGEGDPAGERVTTSRPLPSSLPLLQMSPATPNTPPAQPTNVSSSSPPLPSSSSPIDFVSSLISQYTAPSSPTTARTTTDASINSQGSQGTHQGGDGDGSSRRKMHRSPRSLPGSSPSRKRPRTWDAPSMYPAVSPPQLKRARSGL